MSHYVTLCHIKTGVVKRTDKRRRDVHYVHA